MAETAPGAPPEGGPWSPLAFRPTTVVLASIAAAAVLAAAGSLSDISLGDENPHVRHVRAYVERGTRVPYDPLFTQDRLTWVPFSGTPLWHAGLALLWRLAGAEPQVLAQAYHAGFYLLLVLSVYWGARGLWGPGAGGWAWLLAASMPMACVYGVLLYQDVPGLAVTALGLVLLWRRRYLWAGVALAAAYMTKMNMLCFAPWAVVFAAWWEKGNWKRRLAAAAWVAAPIGLVLGYDLWWRLATYGKLMGQKTASVGPAEHIRLLMRAAPRDLVLWRPFPVADPASIVSHFGLAVLVGTCAAAVRAWDAVARWLWLCLGLAVAGFVLVFWPTGCTQVRYLLPAALPAVLLGGRALGGWRLRGWVKALLLAACAAQAAAAVGYAWHERHIDEWDRAGYAWIREHTDERARIMYPEQVLTNQTGRVFVWGELNPAYFMTEATPRERRTLLEFFRVTHIAVPLRRTYDRAERGSHAGGYERGFVERLASAPDAEKVYENPGFRIFRVLPAAAEAGPGPPGG